jgi:hypothetical protein
MGLFSRFKKKKKDNSNMVKIVKIGPNHYEMEAPQYDENTYTEMKKRYAQFKKLLLKALDDKVEVKTDDLKDAFEKDLKNNRD